MIDFLLDDSMDLDWKYGDFVLGKSTAQNQVLLIKSKKASFKESPGRCVGAELFLEDETPDNLAREIRLEFIADGMKVNTIRVDLPDEIQVDSFYPDSV